MALKRGKRKWGGSEDLGGLLEIAESGGESPGAESGEPAAQPGEAEFGLHSAFGSQKFMPLVDHNTAQPRELGAKVLVGEHEREALGRGDEAEGEPFSQLGALMGGGVAGARFDLPVETERVEGLAQGAQGVLGEGAQGSQPKDAGGDRRWARAGRPLRQQLRDGAEEGGEGLAEAGGGVQETGVPGEIGRPGLPLEREGRPAAGLEDGGEGGGKVQPGIFNAQHRSGAGMGSGSYG